MTATIPIWGVCNIANWSTNLRTESRPTVYVVDDDRAVRESLDALFRSVGHKVEIVASALEFLQTPFLEVSGCLVLDVKMPGLSGVDLQKELLSRRIEIPIVFMTGYGDIPMTVAAMKSGAIDFLEKPFLHGDMLDAVGRALQRDRERREQADAVANIVAAYATLSAREREIMSQVVCGMMNKQIAAKFGLSEITVKQHRGRLMKKMGVASLANLVRAAELLKARG